jgi:RNA polymerase sigma factor (sigma-70 family)
MSTARVIDALHALVRPSEDYTDSECLSRFLVKHDQTAFAELVRRHGPMVYGVSRRILGNGPDADDAFQATFFVLARKAGSIRSSSKVANWLYGVAAKVANKARIQAIKRRVREMAAAKPEAVPPITPNSDLWAILDEELAKLPEPLRVAVLACDVGGMSRSQAAKQLGWPEGTVAKRLAKARDGLAKRLTRRGISLSVAALSAALASEATASVPSQLLVATAAHALAFAFGGGGGSLTVQTLAEGVMRSMISKFIVGCAIGAVVLTSLVGGSIMLASGSNDNPTARAETPKNEQQLVPARAEAPLRKEATGPAADADSDKIASLLKERRDNLKQGLKILNQRRSLVPEIVQQIWVLQEKLLEVELELSRTPQERLAAYAEALKQAQGIVETMRAREKITNDQSEFFRAKDVALRIEIAMLKEKMSQRP